MKLLIKYFFILGVQELLFLRRLSLKPKERVPGCTTVHKKKVKKFAPIFTLVAIIKDCRSVSRFLPVSMII